MKKNPVLGVVGFDSSKRIYNEDQYSMLGHLLTALDVLSFIMQSVQPTNESCLQEEIEDDIPF